MSRVKYERFDKLFKFLPKSKIKAGDGQKSGKYPFFTSSIIQSKYIDVFNYDSESLIFGSVGNANIHYCNQKFATSTDCFVANKNNENIDVKYVYYYLKSNIKILEAGFKGAGLKHISKKYIVDIKIPLLPLKEQQKIVQFLTQIEELINKREESNELLDELGKSIFLDMFQNILTDTNPINLKSFNEIALIDTNMINDFVKYAYLPHIGIANIEKNSGKILDYKLVKDENLVSSKYLFDERHILYSKIRPNLNKVALPNFKGLISADAYPILPNDNEVNKIFLAYLLRSKYFLNYIIAHIDRANIPKVNKQQLLRFKSNIPSIDLQNKFAMIVTQIEQTKEIYQNSLNELKNLFASIVQKIFKGEFDISKIEVVKKEIPKDIIQEDENINIQYTTDIYEENKNNIFDKQFLKNLINQKVSITTQQLKDEIEKNDFKEKVSFEDIKRYLIELLESNEIEQITITIEKIEGLYREIGFRVKNETY